MLSMMFGHVFVLALLHYANCERRLIDGENVKTDKRYMAYLLQAKSSIRNYDAWICGGAILNHWLILTSAACIEDVQNMYAVAGTEKYIKADELEIDPCTQHWRRKVVYTCVPVVYDLQYDNVSAWSHDDIAVVKVEEPFLFDDGHWKECTYSPAAIPINFDPKYEEPGTDAIVLGWGHARKWRMTNITDDFNQPKLQYASVSILDTEECKKSFTTPDMVKQIDDYMICTFHDGKLDETGKLIGSRKYYTSGVMREGISDETQVYKKPNETFVEDVTNKEDIQKYMNTSQTLPPLANLSRRKGICQNDHGGPLVTWINGTEHVIGVASVFRVDHQSNCIGPFLFTSTTKNRQFIECILKDLIHTDNVLRSRSVCDRPANGQGVVILRRYIKWTDDYKHSLATNLNVHMRPQIPMSHYRDWNARK